MGSRHSKKDKLTTHDLTVVTGDRKGASATSLDVRITCTDQTGETHTEKVTGFLSHSFHRTRPKTISVNLRDLGKVTNITIHRDDKHVKHTWYIDRVEINQKSKPDEKSIFPVLRWLKAESSLSLIEFDSCLPQDDPNTKQREIELHNKRDIYVLSGKIIGAPPQVEILPEDEKFSFHYQMDFVDSAFKAKVEGAIVDLTTRQFKSLDDVDSVYKDGFEKPKGIKHWRDDVEFGRQKLAGCNPVLIELCQKLPDHMPVTGELLQPHLEGKTLEQALSGNRMFIIDLRYLANIECSHNRKLPGPTCLFYQRDNGDLVPIAIQLMPEPAEDNPVFTPSDPEYTWLAAKMWFNLADCSHHQSATHLGFTHLLMESVAVCANRRLSPSHPIYKLLAPHFLYIMAINSLAISSLVSPGGWVDTAMHIGRNGMFNIIKTKWAEWNLQDDGNLVKNFQKRGVDKEGVLPYYPYRDDSLLLWNAIEKYVATVVNNVYTSADKLKNDHEVQGWCNELVEVADFKGVPAVLTTNEELIEVVTVFIFISSVGHAAANFEQYDQYGFPPNYPSFIHADRPTTKEPLSQDYVVSALPTKDETVDVMEITRILTQKNTNSLGEFEVQYAYDPTAMHAIERFKADLAEVTATITKRNDSRERKYPYLLPSEIPNAVSI